MALVKDHLLVFALLTIFIVAVGAIVSMVNPLLPALPPAPNALTGQAYTSGTVPPGFAPPWNPHDDTTFLTVDTEKINATTLRVTVEASHDNMIFYKTLYRYDNTNDWEGLNFSETDNEGWIEDEASITFDLDPASLDSESWVLVYGCTKVSRMWKCGCFSNFDTTCLKWSIQNFSKPEPSCTPAAQRPCYSGPQGTLGFGECTPGFQTCYANGTWSGCVGEITPVAENCTNTKDDDCDTYPDCVDANCVADPACTGGCTAADEPCIINHAFGEKTCTAGTLACAYLIPLQCVNGWYDCDNDVGSGCESTSECADDAPLLAEFLADNGLDMSHVDQVVFDAGKLVVLKMNRGITVSTWSTIFQMTNLERLELHNCGLTGELPSGLSALQNLEYLDLGTNALTGSIPSWFGTFSQLRYLQLNYNDLTGSMPPELGQLLNLEDLNLGSNDLTGPLPTELGMLSNLESLELRNNKFSGSIPLEFGQLTALRKLLIAYNQLTGPIPSELGQLPSLYYLLLQSNQLSGTVPPELCDLGDTITSAFRIENNCLTNAQPICDCMVNSASTQCLPQGTC